MKLRIAIIGLGLALGLLGRMAVELYQQFSPQRSVTPPAASSAPMVRSERGN